jgi:hypothetical protein
MILDIIRKFFENRESMEPIGLYYYLKTTARNWANNHNKHTLWDLNPLYLWICNKVDNYIKNNHRERISEGYINVSGLSAINEQPQHLTRARNDKSRINQQDSDGNLPRHPNSIDMVRLTSSCPLPMSIQSTTALILELINYTPSFSNKVPIKELKNALYKIFEPKLIGIFQPNSPASAKEDYYFMLLNNAKNEALEATKTTYRWRIDYPKEIKAAFHHATNDYLEDKQSCIDDTLSLFKYLSLYIPDCPNSTYEKEYKGSFQHYARKAYMLYEEKRNAIMHNYAIINTESDG